MTPGMLGLLHPVWMSCDVVVDVDGVVAISVLVDVVTVVVVVGGGGVFAARVQCDRRTKA